MHHDYRSSISPHAYCESNRAASRGRGPGGSVGGSAGGSAGPSVSRWPPLTPSQSRNYPQGAANGSSPSRPKYFYPSARDLQRPPVVQASRKLLEQQTSSPVRSAPSSPVVPGRVGAKFAAGPPSLQRSPRSSPSHPRFGNPVPAAASFENQDNDPGAAEREHLSYIPSSPTNRYLRGCGGRPDSVPVLATPTLRQPGMQGYSRPAAIPLTSLSSRLLHRDFDHPADRVPSLNGDNGSLASFPDSLAQASSEHEPPDQSAMDCDSADHSATANRIHDMRGFSKAPHHNPDVDCNDGFPILSTGAGVRTSSQAGLLSPETKRRHISPSQEKPMQLKQEGLCGGFPIALYDPLFAGDTRDGTLSPRRSHDREPSTHQSTHQSIDTLRSAQDPYMLHPDDSSLRCQPCIHPTLNLAPDDGRFGNSCLKHGTLMTAASTMPSATTATLAAGTPLLYSLQPHPTSPPIVSSDMFPSCQPEVNFSIAALPDDWPETNLFSFDIVSSDFDTMDMHRPTPCRTDSRLMETVGDALGNGRPDEHQTIVCSSTPLTR
ncbi:uncharacterized protein BJ171DRAFT_600663, partial [Polychytrium aggregatum]|uniref:uncharacterized protein n=1 Tax=Polychytrium aggregatum TaxID=110093 RepID=UPI0022FF3339